MPWTRAIAGFARVKRLTVGFEADDDVPPVTADPDEMRRVLDTSRIEMTVDLPENVITLVPYVEDVRIRFDVFEGIRLIEGLIGGNMEKQFADGARFINDWIAKKGL